MWAHTYTYRTHTNRAPPGTWARLWQVRVLCFLPNKLEKAAEVVDASGDLAAAYHLAKECAAEPHLPLHTPHLPLVLCAGRGEHPRTAHPIPPGTRRRG